MSRQMSVFVSETLETEALAAGLGSLLGLPLQAVTTTYGLIYKCRLASQEISLITNHNLVPDRCVDFSPYKHQIDIHSLAIEVCDETLSNLRRNLAMLIAEWLFVVHQCNSMVVDNLQKELWRSG